MGHVSGCKNETDLNSLSSAVCLASAMPGGPPGDGGPHPPADCSCPLCCTFQKVTTLVFGADSTQVLRDSSRPCFEGLYTQLWGSSATRAGGAERVGEVRPGGPPPPTPAAGPVGEGGGRGDPAQKKEAPGRTGVKEEEEADSPRRGYPPIHCI